MKLHTTVESFSSAMVRARRAGERVGFVPTMGALHAGHTSLMREASRHCSVSAASIFVNPLQFGANEDLSKYPRPLEADLAVCESIGIAHVFAPDVAEMYPDGALATSVRPGPIATVLEGAARPGHFDGVATVVTKLLSIVGECDAYFGEKDWQQLLVVRQLVEDLSLPVRVVGCPTVREADGLAKSSRNAYLSPEQRRTAASINGALQRGVETFLDALTAAVDIESAMLTYLKDNGVDDVDYAVVAGPDLQPVERASTTSRLLIAARVGSTRLIDNTGLS